MKSYTPQKHFILQLFTIFGATHGIAIRLTPLHQSRSENRILDIVQNGYCFVLILWMSGTSQLSRFTLKTRVVHGIVARENVAEMKLSLTLRSPANGPVMTASCHSREMRSTSE